MGRNTASKGSWIDSGTIWIESPTNQTPLIYLAGNSESTPRKSQKVKSIV